MKIELKRVNDASHYEATAPSSSVKVNIDGPESIGGEGKGVRPMELVLIALGSCSVFDLNEILKFRYESFTPLTQDMFSGSPVFVLTCIVDERRFELCYEGFRWFDLKRFKTPIEHDNGPVTVYLDGDDLRYVLQIPEKERSANELMTANPR